MWSEMSSPSFTVLCLNVFVVLLTTADCGKIIFPDDSKVIKKHGDETPTNNTTTATVISGHQATVQHLPPLPAVAPPSTVRPSENSTVHHVQQLPTIQYYMQNPLTVQSVVEHATGQHMQSPTVQPLQASTTYADDGTKLILGLYEAALNIDKSLDSLNTRDPKSDHNVIVSPLCIIAALSLVLLGSRGETKIEIGKLFGFDDDMLLNSTERTNQNYKNLGMLLNNFQNNNSVQHLATQINLAKSIFVQNGYNISANYKTAAKEYLNSELVTVDFKSKGEQAQTTINQWVSNQTHGKINNIMQDIPLAETKTIIASALYFAGEWEHPFFINYTRVKPFYVGPNMDGKKMSRQNKDVVYIPMMVGSSEVLYHTNEELEFKAIGLPYKDKQFVTYFVLPDSNVTLRSLIAKINGNTLKNITKYTNLTEFTYFVPKMTLESFTNLKPVLQNIGINKMFDPTKANLTYMASDPGSYIGDILHKVEVVINEVGTVASAATVVTITRGGQSTFNINRPFLFFIHHLNSDTVIFWGSINKPTPYSTVLSQNLHIKKHSNPISVI